jgi:uncharacterized membrane protein YqjE
MDIRMLLAIHKVIPILLRHLEGYVELAEQDWTATKILAKQRVQIWAALLVSSLFALATAFVFVIALAWDTEYRLVTIGALAGLSAAFAIGAALRLRRRLNDRAFAAIRREWARDRAVVHRLLAEDRSN